MVLKGTIKMEEKDIIDRGLYRLLETKDKKLETWCRHNLLVANKTESCLIRFRDTYWGESNDSGNYVFEDVSDRLEFVFDLNNGVNVSKREWEDYDEKDKTYIPTGGRGERWIINKYAEKSEDKMIYMLEGEIASLLRSIRTKHMVLVDKREQLALLGSARE